MGSAGSQSSKRPSYTRALGDYLGEGKLPFDLTDLSQLGNLGGFFGDVNAQQMFPAQQLFGGFGNLLNAANTAGSGIRDLTSQALGPAFGNSMNLASMAAGQAGQNLNPSGYIDASQQLAQNLNRAGSSFQQGLANAGQGFQSASQVLQNSLNPAEMNPFFQYQLHNQVLPQVDASQAARGLLTSGPGAQAENEATQQLANSFSQQQMQQQLGALGAQQQAIGQFAPLAGGQAQLGYQGGLLPGQVYNQFESGLGQGLQNTGLAQQAQLGPLQALGLGAGTFQQGLNIPFQTAQGIYGATRNPLEQAGNFINSVPSISQGTTHGLISSLFK